MKFVLFYGSLKKYSKRGYNFNRFAHYGEQIFIRELTLDGYEMYDLGSYPAVCVGTSKIKCELHSIPDNAFTMIANMERNAGYQETFVKLDGGVTASLFVMDRKDLVKLNRVKSGDWN